MLTGFQIRAARGCSLLYIQEVASCIGIHKTTLTRLEATTPNLTYISSNSRTALLIKNFYESRGIAFPNNQSISIREQGAMTSSQNNDSMILNKFQFKVSKLATRLNRRELAKQLVIAENTIQGWEKSMKSKLLIPIACKANNTNKLHAAKVFFINLGISYPSYNTVEILDDPSRNHE